MAWVMEYFDLARHERPTCLLLLQEHQLIYVEIGKPPSPIHGMWTRHGNQPGINMFLEVLFSSTGRAPFHHLVFTTAGACWTTTYQRRTITMNPKSGDQRFQELIPSIQHPPLTPMLRQLPSASYASLGEEVLAGCPLPNMDQDIANVEGTVGAYPDEGQWEQL